MSSLFNKFVKNASTTVNSLLAAVIIIGVLVAMVVFIIYLSDGERRISVQYSKKTQGRKMVGGQSSHIPLKVNTAGVIPVIFAGSLFSMPIVIAGFAGIKPQSGAGATLAQKFLKVLNQNSWCNLSSFGEFKYTLGLVIYILLLIFFAYFYTSITFNPLEIADNMKKSGGFIPGIPIPTPFFIALACVIVIALVMKFTNLGLYTQAVGINESSSRLNGLNPAFIKFLSFVILGLCVAVAALIKVSRISTINYSVIAKDIEMDAILAVALGGNSLSGGKFNLAASILGAYVIQFLTTTLYKLNVKSEAISAYKAIVVIIIVVIQSPVFRRNMEAWKQKRALRNKAMEGGH